jgi:dolichol kinase
VTLPATPIPRGRPLLHAATGLAALALGVLSPPLAIGAAALGVVVGWVVLPLTRLDARLRKPGEPFLGGLRTYPVAVLLLVVLLPAAEAAAAWGILAFGDAAAALAGRAIPAPAVLGHRKATWSGSTALLVVGTAGALALGSAVAAIGGAAGVETGAAPGPWRCLAAAFAAVVLDLLPIPPDDNLPCAVGAGAVLRVTRDML